MEVPRCRSERTIVRTGGSWQAPLPCRYQVSSLFCRHNRFTADCPICSKGTVLDPERTARSRARPKPRSGAPGRRRAETSAPVQFSGPHVSSGPYLREHGGSYEVRLERVPGGVRLAQWSGGRLERRAPEIPAADLLGLALSALWQQKARTLLTTLGVVFGSFVLAVDLLTLVAAVAERELLPAGDTGALAEVLRVEPGADGGQAVAASPGRAGDLREELRVERRDGDVVRVARWLLYPSRGWELQDAPPMLPAARYAEAFRSFFGAAP